MGLIAAHTAVMGFALGWYKGAKSQAELDREIDREKACSCRCDLSTEPCEATHLDRYGNPKGAS